MTRAIDLPAYFGRIGYRGESAPTLETLRAIHLRHVQAIAFENLNPLLRWPVRLDLTSLERKLVLGGRGGYCYEHNLLLAHVLRTLGFRVTCLAARVLWNQAEDAIPPRSHMLLRVDLDGRSYVVDGGFGGQTLTGPLRLEPDLEQPTPHEPFRLVRTGDDLKMQSKIAGAWKSLYRFDLQEQFLPDYEMFNHYFSTHPSSLFLGTLWAARPETGRRYTLLDNKFAVHPLRGLTQRRVLTTASEVRETLERVFLLKLPQTPELDVALARVALQGP